MLHPILPLVFRSEEEEAMRACRPGERACMRGEACHAQNLPRGSPTPRFRHWDLCVVCLRADTLAKWLHGLGVESKTAIAQPYYVVIGPGEYSSEACIPTWDGIFDGISDPFVRFDPLRLRWEGLELRQRDVEFTAFPRQIMLERLVRHWAISYSGSDLPDIFSELVLSGLLAPRQRTKSAGILDTLQDALWSRSPKPNLESTWLLALHAKLGRAELSSQEAVRCVYEFLVWYTEQNPVIEARLFELHNHWRIFRLWAPGSSKGASRFLTAIPAPTLSKRPQVITLPCHWVAEAQDRESFVCPTCFDFKGFLFDRTKKRAPPKNKKKKKKKPAPMHDQEGNFIRRGSERVSFCFETQRELCLHVKSTGRKSVKTSCIVPLVHLNIFGCAVQVKGRVFVPCFKCGMLNRRFGRSSDCGLCAKRTLAACLVCRAKRRLTPALVFDNLGLDEDAKVFLCDKHVPRNFAAFRRWNRYHLWREIADEQMAEGSKRHGVKVIRT